MQRDTDSVREGVVVRIEKTHIVIWNDVDDLVVASGDIIDDVIALLHRYTYLSLLDRCFSWTWHRGWSTKRST